MSVGVGVSYREGHGGGGGRADCVAIVYAMGIHPEGESREGFFFSWVCDYQLGINTGCFGWRG